MAPLATLLRGVYYGGTPGALRGSEALYQQALKMGLKGVTRDKVKRFLASQPVYTRHRPARRNYPRNKIDANFPGHVVQVDIMDMQRLKAFNDHAYVLLSYDTFSKLLSGVPLKDREATTVSKGLEDLITGSPFSWVSIYWDKEGAFLSRQVQAMLGRQSIHNYTTKSVVKAPGVERAIRTLRTLLQRRQEASKSLNWEKEMPKLITTYNKRKHSTTKLPPNTLASEPWKANPESKPTKNTEQDLPPIGSLVRLNRLRGLFDKEASDTWTEEVFRVVRHNRSMRIPLIYVEDLLGERIQGGLYPQEYQAVSWDGKRQVDKIIKQRKLKNKPREYYVSYRGWPPKFNAWVKTPPSVILP